MTSEIQTYQPQELVRQSTDVAGLCKAIVVASALTIQGRKYVRVEGWQAIATAHGCVASARDVEAVQGGVRAIGEIRRMNDGAVLATAEGFVGEDEPTWYGGGPKSLPKRPDYAIRAMAQTRAISRAGRSAFAHVVVLMDAGLSTTPAEEVPDGGFVDHQPAHIPGATSAHVPVEKPAVAAVVPPAPARAAARPSPKAGTGTVGQSKIIKIYTKTGDGKNGKPYKKFDIHFADGTKAGTFSEEAGGVALDAERKGMLCEYEVAPNDNPKWAGDLITLYPTSGSGDDGFDDIDMAPVGAAPAAAATTGREEDSW